MFMVELRSVINIGIPYEELKMKDFCGNSEIERVLALTKSLVSCSVLINLERFLDVAEYTPMRELKYNRRFRYLHVNLFRRYNAG